MYVYVFLNLFLHATVLAFKRTGQRECTYLRRLHPCPALRGCLFAVPLNAKTRGGYPMKKAFALAVLLCINTPALAAGPGLPAPLVDAIARQESRMNPLAVNVAGKSYYPATREEAEWLIRDAMAAGKSFDVGKMQVNSWWMKRFGIDPFSLLDPVTNERWGKWILAEEIARHGLNWKAIGKYHSPDPERGRRYAWLVYRHYAGPGASTPKVEAPNAKQKTDTPNILNSRGTRSDQGIGQQSRTIPIHVQQKGVPWVFRPESGASGSKD